MYELLELGCCKAEVTIATLMIIDSMEMTPDERNYVIQKCLDEPIKQIVITHGTDTMVETAHQLADTIENKTIVLASAMIPFKFSSSDGLFNMGSSLSYVQALSKGIYISMNDCILDWRNVCKKIKLGIIEELETAK